MKLCNDCKHYHGWLFNSDGETYGRKECGRNAGDIVSDMVTGEARYQRSFSDADKERSSILPWKCGKKARYFEHK